MYFRNLRLIVLLSSLVWVGSLSAQSFSLTFQVKDTSSKEALVGVNAVLKSFRDTTKLYGAVSDANGKVSFTNVDRGGYRLSLSYIGYQNKVQFVRMMESQDLGVLWLLEDAEMLGTVEVKEQKVTAVQKGDTTEYNADAFKTNPDADVGDLIKKMPGITVDKNGVSAQGEQVKKVLVDGQEFFGDDATMVLKNLPAEIVDKIQVYDQQSEQSQVTGVDDGNTQKTINIVTKTGKSNGQFGKAYAGYGTDSRYQSGINFNLFDGNRRFSLIGMSNNVNQQNFNTDDLLGALSVSSNQRGFGGRGGRGFGGRANPGDFMVGQQSGINAAHSLGMNYQDAWFNKKLKLTTSYFINANDNQNASSLERKYFVNEDGNQVYRESQVNPAYNLNHRWNARLDLTLDSHQYIYYRPRLSTQANLANYTGTSLNLLNEQTLSNSLINQSNERTGYQWNQDIGYRYSFDKRGRTAAVTFRQSQTESDRIQYLISENETFDENMAVDSIWNLNQQTLNPGKTTNYEARVSYSEPIGKMGNLSFEYRPEWGSQLTDKRTSNLSGTGFYDQLDSSLSGVLTRNTETQAGGMAFRYGNRKSMFMIRLNYQSTDLTIDQALPTTANFSRRFNNILPMAFWRKQLKGNDQIRVFFRSSTSLPSSSQLLEVVDNSNPLLLSTGNSQLKQAQNNALVVRYNKTYTKTSRTLFTFLSLNYNRDVIGNSSYQALRDTTIAGVVLSRGTQLFRPVNLPESYSASTNITWGTPVKWLKSNFNVNASYRYSNTPGLVNDVLNKSITHAYTLSGVLSSNISERIDFNLSYTADINRSSNSLQPQLNNNYLYQAVLGNVVWNPWKKLFLSSEMSYSKYTGLGDGYNQNFTIWNMGVAYKFLKKDAGELKLYAFDLLGQNNSIARSITETYVEDTETQVLQRYFMLNFTYTFRNFRSAKVATPDTPPSHGPF
ncbi:MAG: TonB-dependent receptor [Bacteroidetes bacterium]|nr:MAG: TonB-dependent receptor [Bacteroidota bacterium]